MTLSLSTNRWTGWRLFGAIAAAILAMAALILALTPDLAQGVRVVIRATARTSFTLFLLAFVASALAVLRPSPFTRSLVRERRYIGLAFAFSHLVHAVAIATYGHLSPEFWPGRTGFANVPGTIGYVFILLMAATSFDRPARLIGPKHWKRLHLTGMWVTATIFAYSYFKRVPLNAWYLLPSVVLVIAVAVRVAGKRAMAARRRAALRTPVSIDLA
jgi:DMSO/TMAO reductase YedYZ heme-binding membrane subunit